LIVWTWGYHDWPQMGGRQGQFRSHDALRELVERWDIRRIIDVRATTGGNDYWSEAACVEEFGDDLYIHATVLGDRYQEETWKPKRAEQARDACAGLAARDDDIVLICCELHWYGCHRRQVAEYIQDIHPGTCEIRHVLEGPRGRGPLAGIWQQIGSQERRRLAELHGPREGTDERTTGGPQRSAGSGGGDSQARSAQMCVSRLRGIAC